jgi:hypothetical protein
MVLRWSAAALTECLKTFRPLFGSKHINLLILPLVLMTLPLTVGVRPLN